MFELKLKNKTIPLKWGTWAMRRACELAGTPGNPLPLEEFFSSLLGASFDFRKIAIFLQAAAESANRGTVEYTDHDFGDWLDECGGILATEGQIVDFFNYVIKATTNNVTPLPNADTKDEKKSEEQAL
jgi:hypothetical protein